MLAIIVGIATKKFTKHFGTVIFTQDSHTTHIKYGDVRKELKNETERYYKKSPQKRALKIKQ